MEMELMQQRIIGIQRELHDLRSLVERHIGGNPIPTAAPAQVPAKSPTFASPSPPYKPRHTDYDDMSSPDEEMLRDTTQIIRDSTLARQLSRTPSPKTHRQKIDIHTQIVRDGILARNLSMDFAEI